MDDIHKKRNEELRKALLGHSDKCPSRLLRNGANINHAVNENRDAMLHEANTQYKVYRILLYGANVNARNVQGKTPLHTAAETGKCVGIIKELISHCADVNAVDMQGNSPLNYAVRRIKKDYQVIKELVMKGSFVMHCRNVFDLNNATGQTPLSDALLMDDIECVRLLIKYYVLKRHPIAPDPNVLVEYRFHRRYNSMRDFYNKCCFQLLNMRNEVVSKKRRTTLHNMVQNNSYTYEMAQLWRDEAMDLFANRCLWLVRSFKYSVYNDVILSNLERIIDHSCIMNQVRELEIYTCVDQVRDVSPSVDKKNTENDNNCNKVINVDQQKSLWHKDKKPSSSPVSKKWKMESYQSECNPDNQLNVEAHKNACTKFNSSQNDCAFTIGYQPKGFSIGSHKIVDQPQIDILNEELNPNDVYDISAEFNEDVNQPQKLFINDKLNLDDVIDIGAGFTENVDQPQNIIRNEKLNLDTVNDIGAEYNENVNQPQNVILNDKLNLDVVIDGGAGFNENVDQPQMDIPNKKLTRDYSHDLQESVETVAESQNSKSTENKERKLSKRVVLNEYCVTTIAGYLGKRDLFNWFVAYYIPEEIPEEDEGSMDRLRKRILKRVAEKPPPHPHKVAKFC
ncbi:hypothetical protein JTE90_005006 [Oedothorax gibbosus]|uniref:Alpha-latrotoxin n=1 Tax=Oedothorax gibbosus TaxID=931172 RepID=A0AAV6VCT6_9ARAC|nr:hypothetical protein JTE90_005006 [Oedothorax gibbosus]